MAKKGKIPPQFLKNKKKKSDKDGDDMPKQGYDRMAMHGMTGKKDYAKY